MQKVKKKPPDSSLSLSAIVLPSWPARGHRPRGQDPPPPKKADLLRPIFLPGPYATVNVSVGNSIYPLYLFNSPMKES
ncbi:hypothetical protein EYF80_027341 [Liparis tanakae]|uniref:Uncharacterized protein n=1 Tax=Liparis tanakae TaxID=230148 RepID=A0A4Z2HBQ1_9TELE|nr:hypothetical protein EYF80_027341 [Liparis tanakae]